MVVQLLDSDTDEKGSKRKDDPPQIDQLKPVIDKVDDLRSGEGQILIHVDEETNTPRIQSFNIEPTVAQGTLA